MLDAAVEAKHALSLHATTVIEVPFLDGERGLGPITLSRRKFEALCRPLLLKLVPPLKEAMELAGLELQQDIGTLEMGDASHLPPSRQQWQRQVAWRWRRMAKKAGVSSEEGGAGGESSPRLQRFAHAVPVSKVRTRTRTRT